MVEPDIERWVANCPALEKYAATTWGNTTEEALRHILEITMVLQEFVEAQEVIPEEPAEEVIIPSEPRVAATIKSVAFPHSAAFVA